MQPDNPRHDPFAALRVRNYVLFVIGWLPASTGLQMQATALAWEVYERTHDPLALGIIGLCRALPTILLALPAGQIVDMLDRRRVLIATQVGFTLASGLLALGSIAWWSGALGQGAAGLWLILSLVALTGAARVFNGPSRSSLLPQLIPGGAGGTTFHNAITWNSGAFQVAATLGPLLAGWMIWLTGAAWPVYAVAAAACSWFGAVCLFIQPMARESDESGGAIAGDDAGRINRGYSNSIWTAFRPSALLPGIFEGVQHMWREKTVLGAITLDLLAVLLGGATALMPIFAKDILLVGPMGLGMLKAAPYVGAAAMALMLAFRRPFARAGPALLWSVAGFGVCTIVFGLSQNLWLSLAMLALLGALDNISVVIRHVLVSARTPDRLRGRVAAVNSVFIESSNELGGFESGLVAKLFGPVVSAVSGGVGTILVVIGVAVWLPALRKLGKIQEE
jgi:MFS family permease